MSKTEPMPRTATRIDVYADVVCPFTHVGLTRLVERRAAVGRTDVTLHVHAWPLELVNGEPISRELLVEEIAELQRVVAPELFRGFNPELVPMTSLPARSLVARAYGADDERGERASLAVRHALFEEGRDVSNPAEIAKIAEDLGVGVPDANDEATMRGDYRAGVARGVIGSPHFFVDDGDYFCPSLDINRVDDHLRVAFDPEGFRSFVVQCFGADAA